MLTKNERYWAINAKMRMSHKDDFRCGKCGVRCYVPYAPCMCVVTIEDVAWEIEFLSRVAAKLATDETCGVDEDCPPDMPFGWGRLKAARLAVEEELDEAD